MISNAVAHVQNLWVCWWRWYEYWSGLCNNESLWVSISIQYTKSLKFYPSIGSDNVIFSFYLRINLSANCHSPDCYHSDHWSVVESQWNWWDTLEALSDWESTHSILELVSADTIHSNGCGFGEINQDNWSGKWGRSMIADLVGREIWLHFITQGHIRSQCGRLLVALYAMFLNDAFPKEELKRSSIWVSYPCHRGWEADTQPH